MALGCRDPAAFSKFQVQRKWAGLIQPRFRRRNHERQETTRNQFVWGIYASKEGHGSPPVIAGKQNRNAETP
jgi:hypothetical protein